MKHFIYILQSVTSGKLYIGQTNNLSKRILLHNTNQVLSTKHKGPWELIYAHEYSRRSEAMKTEIMLKKWKNREKIFTSAILALSN